MKKSLYLFYLLIVTSITLVSCSKENKTATVIKNCTGYYLRVDGKDYRVCNYMSINSYSHGITIEVRFRTVKNCNSDQIVCAMSYPYEDDIKITYIR